MSANGEYFNQSQLALAAYADFSGATSTFLQALQRVDMSPSQAANFLYTFAARIIGIIGDRPRFFAGGGTNREGTAAVSAARNIGSAGPRREG
jgi:hypothetical protein